MNWIDELPEMGRMAKIAAKALAGATSDRKNKALTLMAESLRSNARAITEKNAVDVEDGRKNGLSSAMIDRLTVTDSRIEAMAAGLEEIAALRDPVGEIDATWITASGVTVSRVRVPLGVIGIIYEARPNVTSDAAGLCLKSGNAVILRGGKEAYHSNSAIAAALGEAAAASGLPDGAVQALSSRDREASVAMMRLQDIDVLIPRGGRGLKKSVMENARVPYIMTGMGNCHIYIDESADFEKTRNIVINAKCQRPGVCNAVETILVHDHLSDGFIESLLSELTRLGVEIRGDERTRLLYPASLPATEEDWGTEYNDLILAVKSVKGIGEAIDHIERYGTHHSDCIVTESYTNARRFQADVDSAAVYVNASTRFTDGGEFGFGAEIGISTQKLHARGPMGLEQLTSIKYIVNGDGQVRGA
ncbi:MAG: glutamate-5-semialdehyde dehydrogenase [Synergistaceae bacterium]|jgi:glutamate-5-semialdehyde dehydrogenase|nr:glutamate-5-semialdehyde dehydrogenase [Synergistaceae bacterium]